ncbi:MAG: FtsX-like permease family protein, partial [Planctomycetes bacterium]|nr:FtsX-like permease family protein [Planctomycetota bacterium]
ETLGDVDGEAAPASATASVVVLRGSAVHAESEARVNRISIFGITDEFWRLDSNGDGASPVVPTGRGVVLNEALADELGAAVGDSIVLRLGKVSAIATDTLLGRRDDVTTRLRLVVRAIVPGQGLAVFSMHPEQRIARNAFVSRELLQRQLSQPGRVNAIFLGDPTDEQAASSSVLDAAFISDALQARLTLDDVGLTLRLNAAQNYVAVESNQLLINPSLEAAVETVAKNPNARTEPVIANLANTIRVVRDGEDASIPYSTVVALPEHGATLVSMSYSSGNAGDLGPGKILLNDWAADALGAKVGEQIELTYYIVEEGGGLAERTASFEFVGSVTMSGAAIDAGLTPAYPGITDADRVSDWDPPFPVDLSRITDRDDAYWETYRTAPKAIVELTDGLRLWHDPVSHHGRFTSIRFQIPSGTDTETFADTLRGAIVHSLDLNAAGIRVLSVRTDALAAGKGSTDFGVLFVSFGFFLLASSAMLVMLLFRLNVERRSSEIGLLAATGFAAPHIRRILLSEGLVIAVVGSLIGLAGAFAYSWLMLAGLRTWWSSAVGAPFLRFYCVWYTPVIGFCASVLVSLVAIAWSLRGCIALAPRVLLSGAGHERVQIHDGASRKRWMAVSLVFLMVAVGVAILGAGLDGLAQAGAFFGSGAATLVAVLLVFGAQMRSGVVRSIRPSGALAWVRLSARNAARHPTRSLLTSALIGSSAFLVLSLQAFRLQAGAKTQGIRTASGGFDLIAESDVPLPYSLASADGRSSLGFSDEDDRILAGKEIIACLLRPGDETSCQNLYVPNQPRILGVPNALIERGGFRFASVTKETEAELQNPWHALQIKFDDGAIPAIADESVVKWQLHSGLNRDLVVTDQNGREVKLRFVALLAGSTLQSELIVSAENFRSMYPQNVGGSFFLIDTKGQNSKHTVALLERNLEDFGFDVEASVVRLEHYFAVQNTYLSTFQTLGGMGLVLGSFGLTAVMLRNVWERRREMALMEALGFSRMKIALGVLLENALLIAIGFVSAFISAIVAVLPHIQARASVIPWASFAWIAAGVIMAGILVGFLALLPTLRSPLLGALRSE